MPVNIEGQIFYRTSEVCRNAGISRATLFRWLRQDILEKTYRDRRGWRLFTEDDLQRIKGEACKIEVERKA